MATRRTTLRSRSGPKLYAVRNKAGQFKDIQTYKRAHGADLRRKSKAEAEAEGGLEKTVRKAAGSAVKTVGSAVKSVKTSVKGAVATVQKTAKRVGKGVSSLQTTGRKLVKSAVKKVTGKPAVKKAVKRTGGTRARKTARKSAAKKT